MSVVAKVLNRILITRLSKAVDEKLREQQTGFRKDRPYTDQIVALRIIIEQSLEWNTSLFLNFVDFEKDFDSLDRDVLWNLMAHYGIPQKFINIIRNSYNNMQCRVIHEGKLTESFDVKTGVKQGCLLSPFLFLLAIDYIMRESTEGKRNGIQWTMWQQLDDLDFADDIALISSTQQMQEKTSLLAETSIKLGLRPNESKTKVMKINAKRKQPIKIKDTNLEEVEEFTYLGSIVNIEGGTDADVKNRINKARVIFNILGKVWSTKNISRGIKMKIFNSNVKFVLLYEAETWRTTKAMLSKIQRFINYCLRKIMSIRWFDKVRNEDLWQRANQDPINIQIKKRKWAWIGHTLRKPPNSITRQALKWNPQGKRSRGRPRNTSRRDTESELKEQEHNWSSAEKLAPNRVRWREFVNGLCSPDEQRA